MNTPKFRFRFFLFVAILLVASLACNALNPGQPAVPTAPVAPSNGSVCVEDPLATTSFTDREVASVDGIPVQVQVRGSCPQPLFYDPTGVATGQNYDLHLPKGWVAIPLGDTMAIHPHGGVQTVLLECPLTRIDGPFDGGVGIYEGAMRITTTEWADGLIAQILPIHSAQCGFDVTPTIFSGR